MSKSNVKAKIGMSDKLSIQVTDKKGKIVLETGGITVRSHSTKNGKNGKEGKKLKSLKSDTMNADGTPREKDENIKEDE